MVMIVNITKHADNRDLRITATEITMLLMDEIVVVSVMVGIRGGVVVACQWWYIEATC